MRYEGGGGVGEVASAQSAAEVLGALLKLRLKFLHLPPAAAGSAAAATAALRVIVNTNRRPCGTETTRERGRGGGAGGVVDDVQPTGRGKAEGGGIGGFHRLRLAHAGFHREANTAGPLARGQGLARHVVGDRGERGEGTSSSSLLIRVSEVEGGVFSLRARSPSEESLLSLSPSMLPRLRSTAWTRQSPLTLNLTLIRIRMTPPLPSISS